jgi:hypothetical protein
VTIALAAEGGQLQLNAFEPIIAFSLYKSLKHLHNATLTKAEAHRSSPHGLVHNPGSGNMNQGGLHQRLGAQQFVQLLLRQ